MNLRVKYWAVLLMALCAMAVRANDSKGLATHWSFDEKQGNIARDTSGQGNDAELVGATRAKRSDGFALNLDGFDDHVDCGESRALGIGGPITLEVWIKPVRKAHGESLILGEGFNSYVLTYYNGERVYMYIGGGGNGIRGPLKFKQWNHVVATFDGKQMSLWINGRQAASRESKFKHYEPAGRFTIGAKGEPGGEKFQGMLDDVRVYNRAIAGEEAAAHFESEKIRYLDPTQARHIKVNSYHYVDGSEVLVEADYRMLLPLQGDGQIEVTLADKDSPEAILLHELIKPIPAVGVAEIALSYKDLAAGNYLVRVHLSDDHGEYPVEKLAFSLPMASRPLASPSERIAPALPPVRGPTPFGFKIGGEGGFSLTINEKAYPFESKISWPNGQFNRLTAGDAPHDKGEQSWRVDVRSVDEDKYEVEAGGSFYTIRREVEVFHTHVYVKDRYTNTSGDDLGMMVYNETPVKPGQVTGSWLSGYERRGRQAELSFPHYSISVFFTDANTGLGIVPIDDVYVVQAAPYVDWQDAAGVGTEKFALAPGASYTLEWAIYPTGSGDYYDFVNTFRKVENRISTVDGPPGYITYSPRSCRMVVDDDFIEKRNLDIGIMSLSWDPADDPDLMIEGIEFMDFPLEMERIKLQTAAIKKKHPGLKLTFHVAHSLYCTNNPDRYADSRVINTDGTQSSWGDGSQFGAQKQAEGWNWWIFYPTPGNSFHDAMMKSVDVMMDHMGFDGAAMDGFFAGYGGQWTYDRWDGHSAQIDPDTKTIQRKLGSVLLLSQPSMIEYCRKIREKGGVVIGMHTVFTRSIANEKYILFTDEQTSGPGLHLAPNMMPLSDTRHRTEKDMYLDMLDKLSWGLLFVHVTDSMFFSGLDYSSLAARQFPITFAEIRSGMVKGKERIVTMNSGVYGWLGDRRLHEIHKFNGRGAPEPNDFLTTVDGDEVRTELNFGKNESAVIEPISVQLESNSPVNVRVLKYDVDEGLTIHLNGQGDATLAMFVGSPYPNWRDPPKHRVTVEGVTTKMADHEGLLSVPLELNGHVEVVIERAACAQ